jgi:chaperonin GroES
MAAVSNGTQIADGRWQTDLHPQGGCSSMAVRPLHDRVLVKRAEEVEQKSSAGIIIPDTAKEKPQRGTVIAVGDGKKDENGKRIPLDVKVGDEVLFGKYSGTEVKIDGEEYLIMHETDILGVLTGSEAENKKKAAAAK